ncbi:MAG: magnesium transporter [Proteobacteria bacterium]|nr:MAG: magnesium transporter [Pseudomonadota bacterium]
MSEEEKVQKARRILEEYIGDTSTEEFSTAYIAKQLGRIKKNDDEEFYSYLKRLCDEDLGDIVIEFPDYILKDVLEHIPTLKLVSAIEELESDDATDLIQDIDDIDHEKAQEVLENLDEKDKEEIIKLISYDEDEAGAYMQAESFVGKMNEKISQAVKRLRKLKIEGELENIHQLFIVDPKGKLLYGISLEDLITFDFDMTFKQIIQSQSKGFYTPILANDHDDIQKIVTLFDEHNLSVLPIVDEENTLVGRITSDDIHDIIQENATEQIYNLAGVDDEAEEEYTLFEIGRTRALWLFLNLLTAIVASVVISIFDATIQAYVALAVLMPIVASMGGNAGTQTLTVVVRKLALGEINFENAKEALSKEVIVSTLNGFFFALIMGFVAFFWFKQPLLGLVIALSMIVNLFFAGFFGALIPLGLKKMNIDPAVGSTVLLTTITDVVGFFSFLGLASWILI